MPRTAEESRFADARGGHVERSLAVDPAGTDVYFEVSVKGTGVQTRSGVYLSKADVGALVDMLAREVLHA